MIKLWPFQEQSKQALRANIRRGVKRQILCSPTGSGKTEIAMSIIEDAAAKGSNAVFLVDRQTLVDQTSRRFSEAGIAHGVAMGEKTRGRHHNIQIVSIQTFIRRGFLYSGEKTMFDDYAERVPNLVIYDEVHDIWKQVVEYLKKHDITSIGLSATPFRAELGEWWDDIVNVVTTNQLLGQGYLAPVKVVHAGKQINTDGLKKNNDGEWVKEDVSSRVKVIVGDLVPEWETQTKRFFGGPVKTIAFCASVADSEAAAEKFQEAGYDFQTIHYRQSADEKREIIDRFREGRHLGLVSCIALTKGFDVPETRCMIDAYPIRKSFDRHIQKLGRVMRRAEGKEYALVIDHAGNFFGFLGPMQTFFSSGCRELGNKKLSEAVRNPPKNVNNMKCRSCGFVLPPRSSECPACGAARKRGDSQVVTQPGTLDSVSEITGKSGTFQGDWWEEICAVANRMSPNDTKKAKSIAYGKYRSLFGEFPRKRFKVVDRKPDPVVDAICFKQYHEWKLANSGQGVSI